MAHLLRIATMNCENLFSRPRIFQSPRSTELLDYVNDLNNELRKQVFDHARIKALKEELAGYAEVIDIRGSHLSAPGADDWLGWIELKRARANDAAIENTARVLADINADVMCLCEVENRPLLQRFHDQLMYPDHLKPAGKAPYDYLMLLDGNDTREIDVAIMSRHPFDWMRTHMYERTQYFGSTVPLFSRDCLEAKLRLSFGSYLTILLNHLKSMGYSHPQDKLSNNRRHDQAARVAEIADSYDLDHELVVVAGDLNSDPSSASVAPLANHPRLFNVVLELPASQRGTYQTGNKQLDYLLVSQPLRACMTGTHIERRGVFAKTKWTPYPTVTGKTSAASDHSAVVADFDL
jgi:endonuclease/exonuclease/phosphatase family metal-dependent hydrolase